MVSFVVECDLKNKSEDSGTHIAKWKPSLKGFLYYMIPTIWQYGKGKSIERIKWSVIAQGLEGGMNGWAQGVFKGGETILYDTKMVDTLHFAFVKTHRMLNTKSES